METKQCHSPTEHDYEVHDVPAVPQVGAFVENKTECHKFDPRFKAEDPNEVWLCLLLWKIMYKTQVSRVSAERMNTKTYTGFTQKIPQLHTSHSQLRKCVQQ